MKYYEHPYVSNSALRRLLYDTSPKDQVIDYKDAFKMGSLVDAFTTEPHRVNLLNNTIIGEEYTFTKEEMALGRKMRDSLLKDSFYRDFIKACKFQTEYYSPNEPFRFNGVDFKLHIKCKYDLDAWDAFIGGDIKSTKATTFDGFIKSCRNFGYFGSRYFYMRNSGYTEDVIIGVSKVYPHKVFKVFIKAGDEYYKEGEYEASELAYKYYFTYGCPEYVG